VVVDEGSEYRQWRSQRLVRALPDGGRVQPDLEVLDVEAGTAATEADEIVGFHSGFNHGTHRRHGKNTMTGS